MYPKPKIIDSRAVSARFKPIGFASATYSPPPYHYCLRSAHIYSIHSITANRLHCIHFINECLTPQHCPPPLNPLRLTYSISNFIHYSPPSLRSSAIIHKILIRMRGYAPPLEDALKRIAALHN